MAQLDTDLVMRREGSYEGPLVESTSREEVSVPVGPGELQILLPWFRRPHLFYLVALPVLYWILWRDGAAPETFLFTVMSLPLVYYVACTLFDTTRISATIDQVIVEHRPLPWFGAPTIASGEISHLILEENEWRGKTGKKYRWEVLARLKDGRTTSIVSMLESKLLGESVAGELEKFLGLGRTDVRPVRV